MAVLCGCGRYFSKPHGRLAWFISWTTLWKYIFCSLWIWFWLKLAQDHNQQHKSMNNQSRERSNNNHIKTCWYCAWSIGGALIVVEMMPYTFFCWLSENSIIGSVTSREWVYLRSVVFELCLEFSCLQRERSTAEKEGWCSGCRVAEQLALLADTQSDSTEAWWNQSRSHLSRVENLSSSVNPDSSWSSSLYHNASHWCHHCGGSPYLLSVLTCAPMHCSNIQWSRFEMGPNFEWIGDLLWGPMWEECLCC